MHDNSNPFGKSANEIVYEHIKDYDFPVCFDFPAGHMKNNQSIIFGKKSDLDINKEVILTQ
jgi:muramoyltetrapeptide carboxypeptidase